MNIFVLSFDIEEAAQYHVNKHVVKMPLESAQMLCTALQAHGVDAPYKPVHVKHPCTLWAGFTRSNFKWLCELGMALCREYTYRYERVHDCKKVIEYCIDKNELIKDGPLTDFAQAMPVEYKKPCAVQAYREYYRKGKHHIASWKKRNVPDWYELLGDLHE